MGWETDRALVRAWRDGDDGAGEVLVREHYPLVRRFFAAKTPDVLDDLVQSTFLSCARARTPLRSGVRFRAMILGFARVELLRYLRQRRRVERRLLAFERASVDARHPTSPPSWLAREERQARIRAVVETLALPLRLTVELRYFEQMSIDEVADALAVAAGTVKSRLSRARKLIRAGLGRDSDDSARLPAHTEQSSDPPP